MRALLYAGCELVTTDDLADALLDYLVTLPLNRPPERVVLPALRDGRPVTAQLLLTAVSPLLVTTVDAPQQPLDGEDYALQVLRRKTRRLDSIGFETQA